MKRTIELDQEAERLLYQWAKALGSGSEEETLGILTRMFLQLFAASPNESSADLVVRLRDRLLFIDFKQGEGVEVVRSTPEVMGGDACIRNTRIAVWTLVDYKQQGLSDTQLLEAFPGLNAADLIAAWDFYAAHTQEVDAQKRRHEDAA